MPAYFHLRAGTLPNTPYPVGIIFIHTVGTI